MTGRKDYNAVASILKSEVDVLPRRTNLTKNAEDEVREVLVDIGHSLAHYFASDNPAFDRGRFLKACGLDWA